MKPLPVVVAVCFLLGTAVQAGPVTVIELGGSHDLAAAVKRVADGKCEYLRVTTKRARKLLD